ncbi:putative bifunctional diguanylate cyclase/phosphodiesterase [Actinoplanes sp. NPDC049681]|uniref:putative bifunctional diguanylate cyclase/phosphodiesterase n=1 Tax=Actinoplanes sp. NPDC049681 TaxID=3363905 RepID=UPI0037B99A7B
MAASGRLVMLADGALRIFWRHVALGMVAVVLAGLSQSVDISTTAYSGMPPISGRTLLLYAVATFFAVWSMLRLPGGGRSWRQLTTAVLDVAVVAVTSAIAASQYVDWFNHRFGAGVSARWLNIAMTATAVAGVVVVIKIMSARRSPVPQGALWWLATIGLLGPLSTVLISLLRPWPHLNGTAAVLPFVGLFGVLAARAQGRAASAERSPAAVAPASAYRKGNVVPMVATGLTSLLLAIVFLRTGHLTLVQVAGTALLLLLVVARQAVALGENTALLNKVAHQAMHDELTGLVGRRYFTAAADRARGSHTVVLIDLKDFRELNDGLGPQVGDELLVAYAGRLRRLAGDQALVGRPGGDEFGLLLRGEHPDLADRLLAVNAEPLHAAGQEVLVDVFVGIAHGDAGDLHRRAEVALRASVASGGRAVVYDASLERQLSHRATMAAELRRALVAGEFHMLYQPIVELPHGRLMGVEALIRWNRADGRVISPTEFIPVAEDSGLIVELGAWTIETVCAQAAAWRREHAADALRSVAVNVSARQLLDPALPDVVAAALARHGIPARQLTIEITETAVFGGGRALATVHALSQLGVAIALDDFGTGHSSLGLLRTCPVDAIKVDKSFIDGLGGTPQQEAIATALTGIADTMGLRTVAEGVETAHQARRLAELGYRHAQGFHFARPMPPAGIDELLRQNHLAAA